MVVDYYERTHLYQIVVCAGMRLSSGSWTWDQAERKCSGGLRPPSLFPERMPQVGLNLRPCGHGAEALLDEPPSHVRKLTLTIPPDGVAGQRAREGCLLLQMPEAVVLGVVLPLQSWDIMFIGIICNGWDQ